MKHLAFVVLLCVLCLLATCPSATAAPRLQAQSPGRDPTFEQAIYDRLAKISPDAVSVFQEATRAGDAGDNAAAKRGFEQVLTLAPDFPDALRRLSYVEIALGDVQAALDHARRARTVEDSPYNQLAVARALLATEDKANSAEALALAKSAVERDADAAGYEVLLAAGMANADLDALRLASSKLIQLVPDYPGAHYVAGLLAADDGKWEKSEQELLLARDLGVPADVVQHALDQGIARQARLFRSVRLWLTWLAFTLVAWLVGLALIFVLGTLLSALTLAAARRPPSGTGFRVTASERAIRKLYAIVIAFASLYFYISIPLLILIMVTGIVGLIYWITTWDMIPLRLLGLVGAIVIVIGYTIFAMLRSMFTRVREAVPGRLLLHDEAPKLWSLAQEVAQRVDTRPVDAIYVTPGCEVAVTERGSLYRKLRGTSERALILGLGVLPALSQGQFRAVLAHEYGHFSNRDTAGGNLALQVRASLLRMASRLTARGFAAWFNPGWLFITGFNRLFLRITLGASRLQEILADRYAAVTFGVRNFVDGLTNIVRQDLAFDMRVSNEVEQATAQSRALHNVYGLPAADAGPARENLDAALNKVLCRPTSPYDSHPPVQERIRLLQPFAGKYEVEGSPEPAWNLLQNPEAIQNEMTAIIQANVSQAQANHAVAQAAFQLQVAKTSNPDMVSYHETLVKAYQSGNQAAVAEAMDELADAYEDRGEHQMALGYYEDAARLYVQTGDREGERVARFNLAEVFKTLGQLKDAEEQLRQVVALDEAIGSPDLDEDQRELAEIKAKTQLL